MQWDVQRPTLPSLGPIVAAIERARSITQLGENWDDEGASAIADQTFERAATFLRSAATQLAVLGIELPVPRISPCADGSIDLYWTHGNFRLLMNVQPGNAPADFFGETPGGLQVKGPFVPENQDISCFRWLLQQ